VWGHCWPAGSQCANVSLLPGCREHSRSSSADGVRTELTTSPSECCGRHSGTQLSPPQAQLTPKDPRKHCRLFKDLWAPFTGHHPGTPPLFVAQTRFLQPQPSTTRAGADRETKPVSCGNQENGGGF
jgi:hypothetical protein